MKNNLYFLLIFFLFPACNQFGQDKYECAHILSKQEIKPFQSKIIRNYSTNDLDNLAIIADQIAECTLDTAEFEVFFNTKQSDLLVIDIFGIENEKQINKIVCSLKNNLNLNLASTSILLFHKYTKDRNDGGIVVGLKLKK